MPLPAGFIPPCLPTKAAMPPSGEAWLHETNTASGYGLARRCEACFSRNGLSYRFLRPRAVVWSRDEQEH